MEKTDRVVALLADLAPANPTGSVHVIGQITREIVFPLEGDVFGCETCLHQRADGGVIAGLKELEDFLRPFALAGGAVALGDGEADGSVALGRGDCANPIGRDHPANPTIAIAISIQPATGCFMRI